MKTELAQLNYEFMEANLPLIHELERGAIFADAFFETLKKASREMQYIETKIKKEKPFYVG